jgi:nucleotide-binding universal stress UspA family protein
MQVVAGPDAYVSADFLDQDWRAMEEALAGAQKTFLATLAGKETKVEWRSTVATGLVSDYVAAQMRAADLLITQPTPRDLPFDSDRYMNIADVLMKAGRPVLVGAEGASALDLASAMVAWNDSREARRAAEDALPLLRVAKKVTLVEVVDDGDRPEAETRVRDVAQWLEGHDITAETRIASGAGNEAAVLDDLARSLDAGLVVAGGYGHSRLREWALGGVTRDLLLEPARCTLISH